MILKIKFFLAYLKFFSFRVVLRLRGIIVAPPIMANKIFFHKSCYLCITNIEIVQNSKSKPKKFSFLCTFNPVQFNDPLGCPLYVLFQLVT
jgi:hypothetical protein